MEAVFGHGDKRANDIFWMGGLRKRMPLTFFTFLIASLSLAGIFPLSGFWSKDEILVGALDAGAYVSLVIGLIGAFLTAFYMFRAIYLAFFGEERWREALVAPGGAPVVAHAPAGASSPPGVRRDTAARHGAATPEVDSEHVAGARVGRPGGHDGPARRTAPRAPREPLADDPAPARARRPGGLRRGGQHPRAVDGLRRRASSSGRCTTASSTWSSPGSGCWPACWGSAWPR